MSSRTRMGDNDSVGADLCVCPGTDGGRTKQGEHAGSPLYKDLPEGWEWKTVGVLAQIIRGVSYGKSDAKETNTEGYIPILRATNIQDNGLVLGRDLVYVPKKYVSEEQKLKIGDIVIATSSGSKHLVGKTAQVKTGWSGSFGAFCAVVRPTSEIEPRYLGYLFNSPAYKSYIAAKAMGVNINNLRRGDIEELRLPLAPFDQQKLIVSEIEKQFSRLDEAVAGLKRVKANLKRYKAAVLKAAVEGKLTEEWRKKNVGADLRVCPDTNKGQTHRFAPTKNEIGADLLKRILAERKKKWEEKNPGKKYKEPVAPDTSNLPELPEGWVWATMPQLGELNRGKSKHRPRNDPKLYGGQYPFIQTGDVRHANGVITKYSQTYSEEGLKQSRLCLRVLSV